MSVLLRSGVPVRDAWTGGSDPGFRTGRAAGHHDQRNSHDTQGDPSGSGPLRGSQHPPTLCSQCASRRRHGAAKAACGFTGISAIVRMKSYLFA